MSDDDPYDLKKLRIDPAKLAAPHVPAKIRKRREQFVMVPMWWYEKLTKPVAKGATILIAIYLLHLHWRHRGKPFKLANGMLEYDGISRQSKWRALADLERRKLIVVERRQRKSPIIHMLLLPNMFHP